MISTGSLVSDVLSTGLARFQSGRVDGKATQGAPKWSQVKLLTWCVEKGHPLISWHHYWDIYADCGQLFRLVTPWSQAWGIRPETPLEAWQDCGEEQADQEEERAECHRGAQQKIRPTSPKNTTRKEITVHLVSLPCKIFFPQTKNELFEFWGEAGNYVSYHLWKPTIGPEHGWLEGLVETNIGAARSPWPSFAPLPWGLRLGHEFFRGGTCQDVEKHLRRQVHHGNFQVWYSWKAWTWMTWKLEHFQISESIFKKSL